MLTCINTRSDPCTLVFLSSSDLEPVRENLEERLSERTGAHCVIIDMVDQVLGLTPEKPEQPADCVHEYIKNLENMLNEEREQRTKERAEQRVAQRRLFLATLAGFLIGGLTVILL